MNVLWRYVNMLSTHYEDTSTCYHRTMKILQHVISMCWLRSIKDAVVRTLISHPTPPHPTPSHRAVNVASRCIINVFQVGGTCVDNVVYIKDLVVRTNIPPHCHPTPPHPIYIYISHKTHKLGKTHRPPGTASATTHQVGWACTWACDDSDYTSYRLQHHFPNYDPWQHHY